MNLDISGEYATYEVITVDRRTREVGEAADRLYATVMPGVMTSYNRIIVCGGMFQGRIRNYCQVYSPQEDG